jgi:hypothetical protein
MFRPLMSMAKVGQSLSAFDVVSLSTRGTSDRRSPIERLELCEAKVSRTVLRGARAGNRSCLPGLRHEVAQTTAERGSVHDSALLFAAGILGEQAFGGRRKLLPRVWSLPDNVAGLAASSWVQS